MVFLRFLSAWYPRPVGIMQTETAKNPCDLDLWSTIL